MSDEQPSRSNRYAAWIIYLGSYEVMDEISGAVVASCPFQFDSEGTWQEIQADAKRRAETIANHLNNTEFDWLAPPMTQY